jgi:glycosyltransferase involved in cell wall biosynthesis
VTIIEATARPFGPRFRGGGERYPLEIARELSKRESVLFVSTQDRFDTTLEGVATVGLRGWSLAGPPFFSPLNPIPTPRTLLQIKGLFEAHTDDLEFLHLHNLRTAFCAAWLSIAKSQSFRSRFHIILTDHGARFAPFPRQLARGVDFYAAVSRFSLWQLQSWAMRPGAIVPPFVPSSLLDLSNRMKDTDRDIDLLYLGRITPWKRADLLLQLIPTIEDILGHSIHVVIAGSPSDPAYLAQLRSIVTRRVTRSKVDFVLQPDDISVAKLYARSRLFALLSTNRDSKGRRLPVPELAGATPLEAAAFGTPSVVSALPGLDEQVLTGRTGFLVDPYKSNATSTLIASVLSDESRWKTLSSNASNFVRTERTASVVSHLLEESLHRMRGRSV